MSFLELVRKRRSCRKYSSRPVPPEAIRRCLEAARLSPSACNSQPWRFIVVQEPGLKGRLGEKAFSGIHKMNAFARSAPVLVVVIREVSKYAAELGGALRGVPYSLIDLGIACEHFILQAAEEDLSTCWLGWFDARAVKKVLKLGLWDKVDIIISLGYAQDTPDAEKKRKPALQIAEFR